MKEYEEALSVKGYEFTEGFRTAKGNNPSWVKYVKRDGLFLVLLSAPNEKKATCQHSVLIMVPTELSTQWNIHSSLSLDDVLEALEEMENFTNGFIKAYIEDTTNP